MYFTLMSPYPNTSPKPKHHRKQVVGLHFECEKTPLSMFFNVIKTFYIIMCLVWKGIKMTLKYDVFTEDNTVLNLFTPFQGKLRFLTLEKHKSESKQLLLL